ncbi:hypothetical protein AAZX31_18G164800 [Glycine max]
MVSLSGFLLPTKIHLSSLMSWDLSMGNQREGQWLQPEGTSLQLMSHKTWCNTTCLWFFHQLLQIFCLAKKKNISIHRGYGRRNQWQITIHDGLPSLAKPWFQHLSKNNLMPGNEVVFFFKFDEHAWEALFRKKVIWDDTLSS